MVCSVHGSSYDGVVPPIQATKVESLEAQIKNMVLDHERELKKKDSEVSYSALFPREMS